MSVSSTTNKVIFLGSGTTGPFDFDFVIYIASDLIVEKYTIATGATATLALTTDYTVTIDGDGTGHIDTVSAVTSSYKLIIRRVLPITQAIDYVEGDKFPSATHEEGLDRGIMIDQQLQEQIDRAVLQNTASTTAITLPGAVEGNVLGWESGELVNKTANDFTSVIKATQAVAEAGTDDTTYMTPLQVKNEVQKSGAVLIPAANLDVTIPTVPVKATGTEIDNGTDDAKFATAKAIADSGIPFETAWTDYSAVSTIVGWTSFTTKEIQVKKIGNTVFCSFFISGTSNATGVTFTLPYTSANLPTSNQSISARAIDNGGTAVPALVIIPYGAATVTIYKDVAGSAWTNSGTKTITGQFFYECA